MQVAKDVQGIAYDWVAAYDGIKGGVCALHNLVGGEKNCSCGWLVHLISVGIHVTCREGCNPPRLEEGEDEVSRCVRRAHVAWQEPACV